MRSVLIWMCILGLGLSACGGDEPGSSANESPTTASSSGSPSAPYEPLEGVGYFDIGNGRELFLNCTGSGSPTVILEAGDESPSGEWWEVQAAVSEQTRACSYDRAGTGLSSRATGCRQLDDILDDLEALLRVGEVDPPYVLVGASGGGFLMAGFAARHPKDVVGMALLETPPAIGRVPDWLKKRLVCDAPTNVEHRDYVQVERTVWNNLERLGNFPLRIVSNDYGPDAKPLEAMNVDQQRAWFQLTPDSKQIIVDSGHDVVTFEPDLCIRTILEVLKAAG